MKLLFFRGTGLSCALIRWQTWSKHSHVAVQLSDGRVIESTPGKGVQILDYPTAVQLHGHPNLVLHTFIGPAQECRATAFLLAQEGKDYDSRGVVRFVLRRLIRGNPKDGLCEQDSWFCSDLVAAAFEYADAPLLLRIPFWKTSPEKLTYSLRLLRDFDPDWDREDD